MVKTCWLPRNSLCLKVLIINCSFAYPVPSFSSYLHWCAHTSLPSLLCIYIYTHTETYPPTLASRLLLPVPSHPACCGGRCIVSPGCSRGSGVQRSPGQCLRGGQRPAFSPIGSFLRHNCVTLLSVEGGLKVHHPYVNG